MDLKFGTRLAAVQEQKVEQAHHLNEKVGAAFLAALGDAKHDPAIVIYCAAQLVCSCITAAIPENHRAEFDAGCGIEANAIQAAHQTMLIAGLLSPMNVMIRLWAAAQQESIGLMSIVTLKAGAEGGQAL